LELFSFAVRVDARAPPCGRSEGHIFPSSDLHVVKSKATGFSDHDKDVSQVAM
jgi:hypothetical protein